MLVPELARLTDLALFLLRLTVAAVFATGGWSHVSEPEGMTARAGTTTCCTWSAT